ncbi:PAS domain-containing sensor histidine kinase [Methylibium sp.]|uniref:PAS domain-containing sensor histidine kinase n=1 Tax=Methylibium sp. TaxID=2067992 RepID=UPI003D1194C5
MPRGLYVAWRLPLAFCTLLAVLVGLLFLGWRDYAELLQAQELRLRSEQVITTLAELDRLAAPHTELTLCVAVGAPMASAPEARPVGARWSEPLATLRRLVADNASQLGRVAALTTALLEWQQLYTLPLEQACAAGQRLGAAYVQSLFRVVAPTRTRIGAELAGLLRTETGLQAERSARLQAAKEATDKLIALVAVIAALLGVVALFAVRGFAAQLAAAGRRMQREANDRDHAQERMLDAQRRLRMVLEHIAEAAIAYDETGRVQWINPAGEVMFGRSRQGIGGQPISLLIPSLAEDLDWPVTQPEAELDGLTPSPWTVRRDTVAGRRAGHDGADVPMEIALVQTHVDGERVGICLCRDLSETERAARMTHAFAALLGEALRLPLAHVRDALALLPTVPAGALEAPLRQQLTVAHGHSERALTLVEDLVELERLRAGPRHARVEPLDLGSELRAAIRAAQPRARRQQVRLLQQPADTALPVQADAQQLGRLLSRLLALTVDASPAGGEVRVSASVQGDTVRVELADGGPDLPVGFAARAFDPFAPPEPADGRPGIGLALAICREQMVQLDGHVGLVAAPAGTGAVFWISLPLRPVGH